MFRILYSACMGLVVPVPLVDLHLEEWNQWEKNTAEYPIPIPQTETYKSRSYHTDVEWIRAKAACMS